MNFEVRILPLKWNLTYLFYSLTPVTDRIQWRILLYVIYTLIHKSKIKILVSYIFFLLLK